MRSFSSSLRLGVGLAAIGALGFGPLATTASADPAGGAYGQPSGGYGQAQAPYGQPADDSGQEDGGPGQGPVGDGSPQDGGYGQRPVGDGSPQAGGYGQSGGGPVDGNDHSAGGYPPNGGYPSNGGYPPNGSYPSNGGYPPNGGYPSNGDYPPNGGYAPSPYGSDAPGVARIDSLQGNVDVQRADSGDTVAAAVNAPLDAGDYLSTGPGSRAELELAGRAALRVAQNTQVRFTSIDDADTAAQVAQGRVVLRLFHGSVDHPEIDTPGATIRPDATGTYWVNVDADGDTIVGVRSGSASVASNGGTRRLAAGDAVAISSVGALGDVGNVALAPDEGFDAYNSELDRAERGDRSYAYLDDRIVGGADLDQYGSWSDVGGYGEAWQPYQEAGWSPYADGRWSWEPYYGWTWVGAEPWGWAPYHYGRWFYRDASWYWTPQLAYARPVYSPALVGFFSFGDGFGGGLGIGVGFGNVGWVPLAPGEAFHPWWGPGFGGYGDRGFGYGGGGSANRFGGGGYANGYAGGGYANGSGGGYANGSGGGYGERRSFGTTTTIVNRTTVTNGNVTRVANYRNASAPGGIVAMRATAFGQGEVRSARVAVSTAQLRDAGIAPLRGVVPVVPNARSLAFADRAPAGPRVATSRFAAVRGRVTSPVATHTFAEQRAAVENATRRDYAASAVRPAGTTDRFAQPGTVRPETVRPATLEGAGSRAGYAGQSATQPGYANAYGTRPSSVNPYGSRPGYANPSGPISSSENAYGARSESASVYGTTNAYGSRPGYASPSASRTSSESAYGARPNSANAYGARPGYASPGGSRPSYARSDEPGDRRLPLDGTATPGRDDAPGRTGAAQPEMYQRTGSGTSGAWQRFDGGGRVRQIDGGGIRQSAPAPQQNPGGGLPGPSTTFGGANGNGPVTRPAPVSVPPVTSGRQGGVESPATIERTSPVDRGYRSPAAPSGLQSHPAGTYRAPHATAGRPAGSAPQHASQGSNAPPH